MQNRTLIETRKQILKEITLEYRNHKTTTRLDEIRAGNDEALKNYLSDTRVDILDLSADGLSGFIDTDNLIEELDLLDDAGILAYDKEWFDRYNAQINAGIAENERLRNLHKLNDTIADAVKAATGAHLGYTFIPAAIAAVSSLTGAIGNGVVNLLEAPAASNELAMQQQVTATSPATDYLAWFKLITVGAFVLTMVVYRQEVAANVKYCKEKLSHTLFGGYDTIPTKQDTDEEKALLKSTVNPSLTH